MPVMQHSLYMVGHFPLGEVNPTYSPIIIQIKYNFE